MSDRGDDDLERRLRDVLHSRGLDVPVAPDAVDRVHAGARRRQQRRSAGVAVGAVAVIAIVAGAIGLSAGGGHRSNVAAKVNSATPSALESSSPSGVVSSSSPISPAPSASAAVVAPTGSPVVSTPPVQVFNPVSVSAVGVNDYWVLGYISADSGPDGITIMRTTDAGQHFTKVGSPSAFVAQMGARVPPDTPTVSDIRFGDTDNGWAYGGNLFGTTDGGASWSAVTGVPGTVVDLAASNGIAWAIVDLSAGAASSTSPQYAVYSTAYGKGAQQWAAVQLPVDLGSTQPSIVDQDGTVTVMASGPDRALTRVHVLIAAPGRAFIDGSGPCEQDLGGVLSNSKAAIWAECPHGNGASLWESSNSGESWMSEPATGADVETGAALGAIDNSTAVVFDAANQRLARISGKTAAPTNLDAVDNVTFVGFTNQTVGFAVALGDDRYSLLYRTADGGQSWTAVNLR